MKIAEHIRKFIAITLSVLILTGTITYFKPEESVSAASETPTFSIKTVNKGTGVKITINKTKGAGGYCIYITKCKNKYSNYMHQNGEYLQEWEDEICYRTFYTVKKDGTKKRTYTIKGLPEGEYTFRVASCDGFDDYFGWPKDLMSYSEFKNIKIDAAPKVHHKNINYDFSNVKVGDVIEFGEYEQDDNMLNGAEPIEWIVLSKDEKQMYVVSKYILDYLPFASATYDSYSSDDGWDHPSGTITIRWNSLREWLNNCFYKEAFTKSERKMLKSKKITYIDYTIESFYGGVERGAEICSQKYKVHMLSKDDLTNEEYGFDPDYRADDSMRSSIPTEYAIARGVSADNSGYWTQGKTSFGKRDEDSIRDDLNDSFIVGKNGYITDMYIYNEAACLDYNGSGVRPAIYIKL